MIPPQASLHTLKLHHPARLRRERRWEHVGQGYEHPCPWLGLPLQSATKPQQCHLQRKEGDTQLELSRPPLHSPQALQVPSCGSRGTGGDRGVFGGHTRLQFVVWGLFVADALPLFVQSKGRCNVCVTVTSATSRALHLGWTWAAGQPLLLWGDLLPSPATSGAGLQSSLAAPVPRST